MTKKDAYIKKMHAQLDEWDAKLDLLKAQMANVSADANIKFNEQIENLEEQRGRLMAKLDRLEEAGEDAWEDIRDGIDDAWNSITKTIKKASEHFK